MTIIGPPPPPIMIGPPPPPGGPPCGPIGARLMFTDALT